MHPLEKILIAMLTIQTCVVLYLLETAHFRHGIFRWRYVPLFLAAIVTLWLIVRIVFNFTPWFGAI